MSKRIILTIPDSWDVRNVIWHIKQALPEGVKVEELPLKEERTV